MFKVFGNAWKVPELRKRMLFTLLVIVIYRLGANVMVPFINSTAVQQMFSSAAVQGSLFGYFSMLAGDAFSQATLFALGVSPYITASIINGYAPDAIVLCEVFEGWASLLPSMLPDYTMVCATRDDGKSNRTPIAYRTDRFTLVDSGYRDVYVKYDETNNRVVTWAVLEDKMTKERLIVFGTHWEVTTEENRVKQAEMTAELIKEITAKYSGAVILAGDFNTRVGNDSYNKLAELTGYTDAVANTPGVAVDHIFFDSNKVTVSSAVIDSKHNTEYASDHLPIICDIELK